MSKVVILSGGPGSGKTTLAHMLGRTRSLCSADDAFEMDGAYVFDPLRLAEAHASCFRHFMAACAGGKDEFIVVHNTSMSNWERAPYVACAQAYNLPYLVVTLNVHPVASGPRNVHSVPAERLYAMWERREAVLPFWPHLQLEPCGFSEIDEKWVKPVLEYFVK